MSAEMDCIKLFVLGNENEIPSDKEFVTDRGYNTAFEFLNHGWVYPHPCFFIWVPTKLADEVEAINDKYSPTEMKLISIGKFGDVQCSLYHVSSATFFRMRVFNTRRVIGGETGFLVKSTGTLKMW